MDAIRILVPSRIVLRVVVSRICSMELWDLCAINLKGFGMRRCSLDGDNALEFAWRD
jgi:hypothetical protein